MKKIMHHRLIIALVARTYGSELKSNTWLEISQTPEDPNVDQIKKTEIYQGKESEGKSQDQEETR